MQKSIFITGAAGFIGFHFAKKCLEAGFSVVAIDNFTPYYSVDLKKDRAKVLQSMGLEVQNVDICDRERLQQVIASSGCTHIVHLAAQAGVRYSFSHPEVYLRTNIDGFLNILEVCRAMPEVRLVYASSSSVYGDNKKIPFSEHDRTDSQTNIYGVTKKSNELMAYSYHHLFKVPSIGLRFFTVYGPWGRPDMAYFSFTNAIAEGRVIDVYNDGMCRRDFTYIDDVVQAVFACLDCKDELAVFNIGNEHPELVNDLIEMVEKNLGKKAKKNLMPMQQGEIEETYADIALAKEKLNFQPKTRLSEGIANFVKWYR
ncbi:MAG: GDP-mannose 4,6-dehydratase, partial [Verrucomicrobia bacterium]|nr:GDP-mannose 4,6-dehydratase [Verrucomicrobiota bacterium]